MPFNWTDYTKSNPLPPRTTGPGLPPINQLVDQNGNVVAGEYQGPAIPRPSQNPPEIQGLVDGALQMIANDPITLAQTHATAPGAGFRGLDGLRSLRSTLFGSTLRPGESVDLSGATSAPAPTPAPTPSALAMPQPQQANASPLTPQGTGGPTVTASPRTGWWASRPEFNAGPSVLDIWNGSTGTGYDANMYATTPSGGRPTFPGMNNSQLSDLAISNPSGAPLGTFTAGPVNFRDYHLNSREGDRTRTPEMVTADAAVQRARETAPYAVGSPQWNQAIQAAQTSAYGGLPQAEQAGRRLELDRAVQMGYTPPGGTPVQGAIANAAQAAAAVPSGAQSAYIRGRNELQEQLQSQGLRPSEIQRRLRQAGYGPVTLGGPELPDIQTTPQDDAFSSALSALRPINPQTNRQVPDQVVPFTTGANGTQQRFFDAITGLMTGVADDQVTPEFINRVRTSFTPAAYLAWLDQPQPWVGQGTPAQIQSRRIRELLRGRTQVPGGPLIINGR